MSRKAMSWLASGSGGALVPPPAWRAIGGKLRRPRVTVKGMRAAPEEDGLGNPDQRLSLIVDIVGGLMDLPSLQKLATKYYGGGQKSWGDFEVKEIVEKRDKRGRRYCTEKGRGWTRVKCPGAPQVKPSRIRKQGQGESGGGGGPKPEAGERRPVAEEDKPAKKGDRPQVGAVYDEIKKIQADGGITPDQFDGLMTTLMKMTVKDLTELKKQLGLKASGDKRAYAHKIVTRAFGEPSQSPTPGEPTAAARPPKINTTEVAEAAGLALTDPAPREALLKTIASLSDEEAVQVFSGFRRPDGMVRKERAETAAEVAAQIREAWAYSDWMNAKIPEGMGGGEFAVRHWPQLESVKDRLFISDPDEFGVKKEVYYLASMPEGVLRNLTVAGFRGFYAGAGAVPELDDNQDLRGGLGAAVGAKGKGNVSFDNALGVYRPKKKSVTVGKLGGGRDARGSSVHEMAHFLGDSFGFDKDEGLKQSHQRLFDKLSPYERQREPGSKIGRKEMFAEGVRSLVMDGYAATVNRYDQEFADHVREALSSASKSPRTQESVNEPAKTPGREAAGASQSGGEGGAGRRPAGDRQKAPRVRGVGRVPKKAGGGGGVGEKPAVDSRTASEKPPKKYSELTGEELQELQDHRLASEKVSPASRKIIEGVSRLTPKGPNADDPAEISVRNKYVRRLRELSNDEARRIWINMDEIRNDPRYAEALRGINPRSGGQLADAVRRVWEAARKVDSQSPKTASGEKAGRGPLTGLSRGDQIRQLGRMVSSNNNDSDPMKLAASGAPEGLDMAAFRSDVEKLASDRLRETGAGTPMDVAYAELGKKYGLSKYDFLRAVSAAHFAQDSVRMSGMAGTIEDNKDPELLAAISRKLYWYINPPRR